MTAKAAAAATHKRRFNVRTTYARPMLLYLTLRGDDAVFQIPRAGDAQRSPESNEGGRRSVAFLERGRLLIRPSASSRQPVLNAAKRPLAPPPFAPRPHLYSYLSLLISRLSHPVPSPRHSPATLSLRHPGRHPAAPSPAAALYHSISLRLTAAGQLRCVGHVRILRSEVLSSGAHSGPVSLFLSSVDVWALNGQRHG